MMVTRFLFINLRQSVISARLANLQLRVINSVTVVELERKNLIMVLVVVSHVQKDTHVMVQILMIHNAGNASRVKQHQ